MIPTGDRIIVSMPPLRRRVAAFTWHEPFDFTGAVVGQNTWVSSGDTSPQVAAASGFCRNTADATGAVFGADQATKLANFNVTKNYTYTVSFRFTGDPATGQVIDCYFECDAAFGSRFVHVGIDRDSQTITCDTPDGFLVPAVVMADGVDHTISVVMTGRVASFKFNGTTIAVVSAATVSALQKFFEFTMSYTGVSIGDGAMRINDILLSGRSL